MDGLAPVLICTVLTNLLSLAQLFRPRDLESLWQTFFLLGYFFLLRDIIIVLCCVWLVNRSHFDLQFPLELSLLNEISVEVVFLWKHFSIPRTLPLSRILIPTLAAIAGSLLVVGPGVSFHDKTIGRYVAFAGCLLFHASAAAVFNYHLRYSLARHRKLICISVIYGFAALGGFLFLLISDGYMFLLANCILGCLINISLLALARKFEWHKEEDGGIAASLRDEGSVSARLSLESFNLNTEEASAGSVMGV